MLSVKEIRTELEKYDRKELTNIIIELYKRIPKAKKEEHNIDDYIKNMRKAVAKKDITNLSLDELFKEIDSFLAYANEGYYSHPNKVISNKDRTGWRFKVKKYLKELDKYSPETEEGKTCTNYFIKIYKILSYGSNYLTFSNWETFRAVGIEQYELSDLIMKRILASGYTKENIILCMSLLDVEIDPYGSSRCMFNNFCANLKKEDVKILVIELIKEKLVDLKKKIKDYDSKEKLNAYSICVADIYISMGEIDKALKIMHDNLTKPDNEVKEYIILEELEMHELYEDWIKEYEAHKIDYRDCLKEKYKKFKKEQ